MGHLSWGDDMQVSDHIIHFEVLPGRRTYELAIGSEYMASRIPMTGIGGRNIMAEKLENIGHAQLIDGGDFEVMDLSTGDISLSIH